MIPYVREIEFQYGVVQQVSPRIRRLIANNPGPFTYTGTGTYIVGHGEVAVIDPGPDLPDHLAALLQAIAGERVVAIAVTHHHADHWPLSAALQAATGAPTYGSGAAQPEAGETGEVPAAAGVGFRPDVSLRSGEIAGPGWTLEAIPTPGHTADHLCYALKEENALFSGDHVMGWSTTVIAPPDGDLTDYLRSLAEIRARGFATLWPTHGPPIREPAPFIDAYAAHRQQRIDQVLEALAAGPAGIAELVPRLYADVDPKLWPAAARSMLAAAIHLERLGRIRAEGETYRLA